MEPCKKISQFCTLATESLSQQRLTLLCGFPSFYRWETRAVQEGSRTSETRRQPPDAAWSWLSSAGARDADAAASHWSFAASHWATAVRGKSGRGLRRRPAALPRRWSNKNDAIGCLGVKQSGNASLKGKRGAGGVNSLENTIKQGLNGLPCGCRRGVYATVARGRAWRKRINAAARQPGPIGARSGVRQGWGEENRAAGNG